MKYPVIFLLLAATLAYRAIMLPDIALWVLLWPAANLLIMAVAYTLRKPGLILGKTERGQISRSLLMLNLPWLILSWLTLWLQSKFTQEPPFNQIGDTNLYIGRCPFPGTDLGDFTVIIDLTAEFWYRSDVLYVCRPNLDGAALINCAPPCTITDKDKVLINCAQGHGRSATYAALLLGAIYSRLRTTGECT